MLPPPIRYFPLEKGLYEVTPGLRSLYSSQGNQGRDSFVFQFDSEFQKYRQNKWDCRQERLGKYFCTSNCAPVIFKTANQFIVNQLVREHPDLFVWKSHENGGVLECLLTEENLELDENFELRGSTKWNYVSAFDALCCQVQEDIAIVSRSSSETDWLAALHLCSPSHWAAEDKIGKNFFDVHVPVPGIEKINKAAASFVEAMIHKGPYVRFVWGFGTDQRLNHHPIPPPGFDLAKWKGRSFQRTNQGSPFTLRMERQVIWGMPEVQSAIFMIRVYFVDGEEIRRNPHERETLRSALLSMTPESRAYKGLSESMNDLIAWLDEGRANARQ